MSFPKDVPVIFEEIITGYRVGTITSEEARKRIYDAIEAEPSLQAFKDDHLRWIDHDDSIEWGSL